MPRENQVELFIRVLAEELEAYRALRKLGFSGQVKPKAKRLRQPCQTDHKTPRDSPEPIDCLQVMSTALQRRIGL